MKRQLVLTGRQAGALAGTMIVTMLATIGGSLYLTRQPTDELRDKHARVVRLTTGLGDCLEDRECRRAFRKLVRGSRED